jgi:hypothetical protein
MISLLRELLRFGDVPDPDGSASLGGGTGTGGPTREGVGEAGGMVFLGASGPWGRSRGPTVFLTVRWVSDPWSRLETIEIHYGSSSSSPSSSSLPHDEDPNAGAIRLRLRP